MKETAVTGVPVAPFERIVIEFTYEEFMTIGAVLGRRTRVPIKDKLYDQFSDLFAKYHRGGNPSDSSEFMKRYMGETFSGEGGI